MLGGDLARRLLRLNADPAAAARQFVHALNERNFQVLRGIMAPNFVYTDPAEQTIQGREGFVRALEKFVQMAPDARIEVDAYSRRGDRCLLNGRIASSDPQFCAPSLWDLCFSDDCLTSLHAYRRNTVVPLVQVASEGRTVTELETELRI